MALDPRPAIVVLVASLALTGCGGLGVPTPTPATGLSVAPRPTTAGAPAPTAARVGQAPASATGIAATASDAIRTVPGTSAATPSGAPTPGQAAAAPATPPGAAAGPVAALPKPVAAVAPTAPPSGPASTPPGGSAQPAAAGGGSAPPAGQGPPPGGTATPTPPDASRAALAGAPETATPTVPPAGAAAPSGDQAPAPGGGQAAPGPAAPTPVVIGTPQAGAGGVAPSSPPAPGCGPNGQLFGLYAWSGQYDAKPTELTRAREACATLAQITVPWRELEFTEAYNDQHFGKNGSFFSDTIAPFDRRIKALVEAGLQPILLVTEPPEWAAVTPGTQGPLKPDKVDKYADFVKRLIQRYAEPPYNVRHVVLWPEPDHRGSLVAGCAGQLGNHRAWGDAPDQFVQMLRTTYPVLKAARPDVQVIMGAVAYDGWGGANRPGFNSSPCGAFNYTFLDDVLAGGGASYFDVFAFNSYGVFAVGWEQNGTGYDVAAKASYIRNRFSALAAKPFMVLEAGVWSGGTVIPVRMPDGSVGAVQPTEDWQGGYPAKLFARGLSAGLRGILWYGLKDVDGDAPRGLMDRNLQPKKAYHVYRQAVLRLSGAAFQSALSLGPSAEGYLFALSGGERMAVLWAVGDASAQARVSVALPGGNVRSYDALGNQLGGVEVSGGTATLTLGTSPVYLVAGP